MEVIKKNCGTCKLFNKGCGYAEDKSLMGIDENSEACSQYYRGDTLEELKAEIQSMIPAHLTSREDEMEKEILMKVLEVIDVYDI